MKRGTLSKTALSVPVDVRTLPAKGHPVRFEANEEQRETLARLNGLVSLDAFTGDLLVTRWRSDGVEVRGSISADVVQRCVVSLEPVPSHVEAPVEATFVPEGSPLATRSEPELTLDPEGDDPPETFEGPTIDVGALASEFLALSLDPYPRAEGAALGQEASVGEDANPFAKLGMLKDRT